MAISVELKGELEVAVQTLLDKGRYTSVEDLLLDGVGYLLSLEDRTAEFETAIAEGLADIDAGRVAPADEVFERLIAKYKAASAAE